MRTLLSCLLAACAGILMVSCVTVARQEPLTIELFDSRVETAPAPADPMLQPQPPQPIPAAPPAQVSQAARVKPAAAPTAAAAPAPAVPTPPPAAPPPPQTTVLDESLPDVPVPASAAYVLAAPAAPPPSKPTPPAQATSSQPRQPAPASVASAQPKQPTPAPAQAAAPSRPSFSVTKTPTSTSEASASPASSVSAAAGAPTSKPAGAPTSKPASAPTSRPASAPTSTAVAAASAPAGGAAASAPTAGASAAGTTAAPGGAPTGTREIYARVGDELQVGMDGTGFLFLGLPDSAPADGMTFKGKENRDGKTWFTFKAQKLGTYDLGFQQQDNTTGTTTRQSVRVHVVTDQDFASAVQGQPDNPLGGAVETGDPAFADRMSGIGAYEAAIAELMKGYSDGNPALNDRIASLYMRTGALDAAARYYGKNLSPKNPYTDSAVLGMVNIAIDQKDQPQFMSLLRQLLAVSGPAAEKTLIRAARMERDQGQVGVGLDLVSEYADRYPQGRWHDEAEFIAAQLLEGESQFRDIGRARDLYQDIVKNEPESAFAGPARDRVLYIDRHFFQVR